MQINFESIMNGLPAFTDEQLVQLAKESKIRDQQEARARLYENRIKALAAPKRFADKNFSNFTRDADNEQAYIACGMYARNFADSLATGGGLILSGMVGTGKTHLAIAIAKQIIKKGRSAKYTTARGIVTSIRDSWGNNGVSEAEVIERLVNFDLLIVDEVGLQFGTDSERVHFFDVMGHRYDEVKPTILIGNLSIDEMSESLGERVIDRMREKGTAVVFDWASRRSEIGSEV